MDEAIDPGPCVAGIAPGHRSLSARRPDAAQDRLQAQARLVLRPRLHRGDAGQGAQQGDMRVQALRNAACSAAVAAWT